jgi:hypothetical protein
MTTTARGVPTAILQWTSTLSTYMNTQLIVDNVGNIVFLQAGFLGAQNDAANFF